ESGVVVAHPLDDEVERAPIEHDARSVDVAAAAELRGELGIVAGAAESQRPRRGRQVRHLDAPPGVVADLRDGAHPKPPGERTTAVGATSAAVVTKRSARSTKEP